MCVIYLFLAPNVGVSPVSMHCMTHLSLCLLSLLPLMTSPTCYGSGLIVGDGSCMMAHDGSCLSNY